MSSAIGAEQALAAQRCASCPKMCRSACPTLAVTANERHQPWGHARVAVQALASDGGFAAAAVVDSAYACAVCAACTVPCKVEGVETPELTWAVRAAVHAAGATPAAGREALDAALASRVLVETSPPRYLDAEPALAPLRELATPGADLLLWPGCGVLGRRPAAALSAARALAGLGVAFQVADRHVCCGMPTLTYGDSAGLDRALAAAATVIAESGAGRVAVQSPSCATLLGVRASVHGRAMPAVVQPLAAVIAEAGVQSATSRPAVGRVAYHDPCHLVRHQSVGDAPRAALQHAGFDVVELAHRGGATRCSGQGGGLPLTHPAIAEGYLARLVEDVVAADVDTVVTGCGSTAAALAAALPGHRVLELAEALENPG